MVVYRFRVWLSPNEEMGYDPFSRAWRDIEVNGEHTLVELHEAIFEAFDRWDEQEYAFVTRDEHGIQTRRYVGPEEYDGGPSWPAQDLDEIERFLEQVVPEAPEETKERFRELRQDPPPEGNAAETTVGELDPAALGELLYVFDLERRWEHRLELKDTREDELEGGPEQVNQAGGAPAQYPEETDSQVETDPR